MGSFRIASKLGKARKGVLETNSGEIRTPFFMPIATKGAVKGLDPTDLESAGAQIVLANTYHLWLRPGDATIAKFGKDGLHSFMGWKGPILSDSGGYQVFSLAKLRKMSERGVEFRSHLDGEKRMLTPEIPCRASSCRTASRIRACRSTFLASASPASGLTTVRLGHSLGRGRPDQRDEMDSRRAARA